MRLFEQYRPRSLSEVVGQDRAVATLTRLMARGLGGRALWLTGPSGAGKTTLAKIAAGSIADDWMTREYHSADELTLAELAECERSHPGQRDVCDVREAQEGRRWLKPLARALTVAGGL